MKIFGFKKIAMLVLCGFFINSCSPDDSDSKKPDPPNKNVQIMDKVKVNVTLKWKNEPAVNSNSPFTLTLSNINSDQPEVNSSSFELRVFLWMPGMGHGSSPVDIQKTGEGIFLVDNVYFIMPGYWVVHVQLYKPGTQVLLDETQYSLTL